jgi:hypothetical protein
VLAGFLVGVPLLEFVVHPHLTLYSTPEVNLPIMIGSAVLAAPVLFWATRSTTGLAEHAFGIFVGMVLATVAFSALGVYLIYGFAALLGIIGVVYSAAALILGGTVVALGGLGARR